MWFLFLVAFFHVAFHPFLYWTLHMNDFRGIYIPVTMHCYFLHCLQNGRYILNFLQLALRRDIFIQVDFSQIITSSIDRKQFTGIIFATPGIAYLCYSLSITECLGSFLSALYLSTNDC